MCNFPRTGFASNLETGCHDDLENDGFLNDLRYHYLQSYFEMGGSSTNNRLFALRQVLAIQTEMSLEMDGFQFEKDRALCVFFEESPC